MEGVGRYIGTRKAKIFEARQLFFGLVEYPEIIVLISVPGFPFGNRCTGSSS